MVMGTEKKRSVSSKETVGCLNTDFTVEKCSGVGQDLNLRPSGYETENAVEYTPTHKQRKITQSV